MVVVLAVVVLVVAAVVVVEVVVDSSSRGIGFYYDHLIDHSTAGNTTTHSSISSFIHSPVDWKPWDVRNKSAAPSNRFKLQGWVISLCNATLTDQPPVRFTPYR